MDSETGAQFAEINAGLLEMRKRFDKVDRYFELSQTQHMDLRTDMHQGLADVRSEMNHGFAELRQDVSTARQDLAGMRQEFARFRDWTATQFSDVRSSIVNLTRRVETTHE